MLEYSYIEDLPQIIDHFTGEDIPLPTSMDLEITSRCNLRCSMCPKKEGLEPNPSHTDMSWETFKNVIKTFPELDRISLSGFGESFLHHDFIDMIREVKKFDISTNVTTNGLLIKKEIVEDLVLTGLDHLSFSLDSLDPQTFKEIRGTDKLEKIIENIKLVIKTKEQLNSKTPFIGLSFTAMSRNIDHLYLCLQQINLIFLWYFWSYCRP